MKTVSLTHSSLIHPLSLPFVLKPRSLMGKLANHSPLRKADLTTSRGDPRPVPQDTSSCFFAHSSDRLRWELIIGLGLNSFCHRSDPHDSVEPKALIRGWMRRSSACSSSWVGHRQLGSCRLLANHVWSSLDQRTAANQKRPDNEFESETRADDTCSGAR